MNEATSRVATRRRPMVGVARILGRHRRASAVAALALVAAGSWAWWATQLWGLPDVGDPFDIAALEATRVPDGRNAFRWYRDAASMSSAVRDKIQANDPRQGLQHDPTNWREANPTWRDFLAQSGEALAIWRIGSEKPDARYDHPEGLSLRTLLPVTQQVRSLGHLAVLEGSRLEAEGDMAGAWAWYRAALRSSRHLGKHGCPVERLMGTWLHDEASKALTRWASDPRVDGPSLRRAIDEVIAIDAMTVPRSEPLRVGYQLFLNSLDDPNLIEDLLMIGEPRVPPGRGRYLPGPDATRKPVHAAKILWANDRQRSLRLARLLMANWLAEVDKPPRLRSKLARNNPPIYESDPAASPASRALPPEQLSKWLDSSPIASHFFPTLGDYVEAIDQERSRQARLVVHLADQLYRREHGGPPPSPQALVGPYLKALPDDFNGP